MLTWETEPIFARTGSWETEGEQRVTTFTSSWGERNKKPQEATCCNHETKYLIVLRLMKNKSRYILKNVKKSPC
jgi:hypothetical protein